MTRISPELEPMYAKQMEVLTRVAESLDARILYPEYHAEHNDPRTCFLYANGVDDDFFFRFTNTDRAGRFSPLCANGGSIVMTDEDWEENLEWSIRLAYAIWKQDRISTQAYETERRYPTPSEMAESNALNETIVRAMTHLYGKVYLVRDNTDDAYEVYSDCHRNEDSSLSVKLTKNHEAVVPFADMKFAELCVIDPFESYPEPDMWYTVKAKCLEDLRGVTLRWFNI